MSRAHVVTSSELLSLRDLELMVRTTVEGLRQGLHRSPFHGYSAEFSQYRHYRPGDDLRYVDWKAFARTDRLYTRQFRETTNMAALFVVDASRSMDFPHGGSGRNPATPTKFGLARAIAAVLGTLVLDQGDAAGLLAVGDQTAFVAPRSGHHHLRVFLARLAALSPGGATPFAQSLKRVAGLLKRRGLIVVLSDFYDDGDALAEVALLSGMGHDVVVIHTLAEEELTLPAAGASQFEDLETGRTLIVDPDTIRSEYAASVQSWLRRVERELQSSGLDYLRMATADPFEPALRRFLVARRRAA